MRIDRIKAQRTWTEAIVIRLFRRWVAARAEGVNATASLVSLGGQLQVPPMLPVALESMLQLTEACLGRTLQAECCCSQSLSADERAILLLIADGDGAGSTRSCPAIPHGLPGALVWAVSSVRLLIVDQLNGLAIDMPERCPFEQADGSASERNRRALPAHGE